ncbi:uncharacterized protein RAG0_09591 [Rhynchosporium agropyri]|uniref:SET domain-containing protein n=1 Tax=Rhynchosporium agropyri TaxID=914238 RepID=A0A1E1KW57_9HELO|nr:uncharacterized protein RAG0_09591 [Rhynchosporium agropyri]
MSMEYQPTDDRIAYNRDRLVFHTSIVRKPIQGLNSFDKQTGIFAKVDIAAGTLLEKETVHVTAVAFIDNPNLEAILKSALDDLYLYKLWMNALYGDLKRHSRVKAWFREYAIPLYSHRSERYNGEDFEKVGFFATLSLFRHGCLPNAHFSCNPKTRLAAIHTTHNVRAGEEITVTYLPASSYDTRWVPDGLAVLKQTFGMTCTCPLHSNEGFLLQAYKTGFNQEREDRLLLQNDAFIDYPELLATMDRIRKVYMQYKVVDVRLFRMYEEAIATACSNGDLARAAVFAFYAKKSYALLEGAGSVYGTSVAKMHIYKNNTASHPKHKSGGQWASCTTQIPRAFGRDSTMLSTGMKNWLWMRGDWRTLLHGTEEYRNRTGLNGPIPFASFDSEDEVVPFDIDARLGPWDEVYPKYI